MSVALKLPERLDSAAAGPLADELKSAQGQPIHLDAGDVSSGGALGLQVLVAACRQWRHDTQPFRLDPISDSLVEACQLLGIALEDIGATDNNGGAE